MDKNFQTISRHLGILCIALSVKFTATISPLTTDNGDLKEGSMAWLRSRPCEAGYACQTDEWCSPSRNVCRPCSDLQQCNNTDFVHDIYPTCLGYCYQLLEERVKTYEVQNETLRQQLTDTKLALDNLTKTTERINKAYINTMSELQNQRKAQEGKDIIVAALACGCVVTTVWGIAATLLWYSYPRRDKTHPSATADSETLQEVPRSTDALLPESPTAKAPIPANAKDSGEFCGTQSHPGVRVTGDAAVVPC